MVSGRIFAVVLAFAGIFVGLGLLAYRGTKKNTAAIAAS
jgi:cbb3-type cytochrome oxidase subunit 3